MRKCLLGVVGGLIAGGVLGGESEAQAQNASLTVYMRAAGSGTFNKTGSISTQVNVYAVSGLAAKYNGSTNLYAPTGLAAPGTAFNQQITNLYSPAAAPGNTYQIRLSWTDNASKQLTLGFYTLAPGANTLGSGGLGTTTPIDITNDPPPPAQNLNCYQDLPDRSTQLYLYWTGVLIGNVKDLSRTELHVSTTAGFTPSAATLFATPPYGTDYRKLSGLKPATDYYYCVRVIDNYGAYTDTCRALPCTTAMSTAGGMDGGMPTDAGSPDGGAVTDGGIMDGGAAMDDGSAAPADGGGATEDAGAATDDSGIPSTPDIGFTNGGSGAPDPPQEGSVAVGCGCSLIDRSVAPGGLALLPALLLLLRRRRRLSH